MKLYYSPSACSMSPHIVLCELGLPYTLERVNLREKKTASGADFLAINPKGYVPALELDDGQLLTEGPAIGQYLADKYAPGTLAPLSGTLERARVNEHLTFIGTELHKNFSPLFNPALTGEARDAAVAHLAKRFGVIEQVLADGRSYLTGNDFTLADIYLFVVQRWAAVVKFDLAPFPSLLAFAERVATRPAVVAAMAAEQQ